MPTPGTLQQLLVEAVRRHNVLPLTGRCNLSCCFCSHGQNPPGTQAYTFLPLEAERLLDLMPFLDPEQKIIIGESATRLREGEPLTHPDFFAILEQLRRLDEPTAIERLEPRRQSGGRFRCAVASWNACAARRQRSSRCCGATSCSPTGSPSAVNPHGTDSAGCCVRLNG